MERNSGRFSTETDSTLRDIWRAAQRHDIADPEAIQQAVDIQRNIRSQANRWSEKFAPVSGDMTLNSPIVREKKLSKAARRSTDFNLQKSLLLLDKTVGTPGSNLLRLDKKKDVKTTLTPRHLSLSRIEATTPRTPGLGLDGSLGTSANKSAASFREQSFHSIMEEDDNEVTTTNVGLLLHEDPGLAGSSSVFGEFKQQLLQHPAEHQAFDLLAQYESICNEHVTILNKLLRKTTPGQLKFKKVERQLEALEQEKQTWRLIRFLFRDRLDSEMKQQEIEEVMEEDDLVMPKRNMSDKEIVSSLFERQASVRQAQLVVDWLESGATEKLDTFYERVEFFQDTDVAWENMLHMLQQTDQRLPLYSDRQYITEMDPDAPVRQRRALNDQDQEDEGRLLRYLFACVRAGQLDDAQKLCVRCGQAWRAATLEGWRLYNDPNFGESRPVTLSPVEGNFYRDIWKVSCWRLAENEQFDRYERAMYGALSGNIKQVLPVCEHWPDYVWAYFRAMVDTRVEQEIRLNSPSHKVHEELPKHFWDKVMSPESIFKDICASTNDAIRAEGREKFHVIQKCMILGDMDALIEEMFEWDCTDRHLVRFIAHLILFLQAIGVNCSKENLCMMLLERYIRNLADDRQIPLVATYVSKLPQDLQVTCYATFLQDIREKDERRLCLELAAEAGLDIARITRDVVTYIRCKGTTVTYPDMPSDPPISDEDREKIDAIYWLLFDETQRSEAMIQANDIIRNFLVQRKYSAARAVFEKLPANSLDVVIKTWQAKTGHTELSAEMENAIREYLCIKAYLDAQDSFNNWFEHYHNGKPVKPDVDTGGNFADRVAYEHKEAQYSAELERWQHSLQLQTKRTIAQIYNVLLFPDGGWMVDQREVSMNMGESRETEMKRLRMLCLPTMCFLARTVLHSTEQYQECLQLADAIADENHQLYTLFHKDELQRFLQELTKSAVELLNQHKDPLGYPSS